MLGVLRDYLVEWGSSSFTVFTAAATPQTVVAKLIDLVLRSQPGRAAAIRDAVDHRYDKLSDAIHECGRAMVQFVYDTIERSRRRSLREMWLALQETGSGEELRQRVLDYLTEGDVAPVLERLVDSAQFRFSDWIEQWSKVAGTVDARELRAASARLLSSYPDHPGLLASRGLAEALDLDGELVEFELNLTSALRSAAASYAVQGPEVQATVAWILGKLPSTRPGAHAAAYGAAVAAGLPRDVLRAWIESSPVRDAPAIAIIDMTLQLDDTVQLADEAIQHFQEI